MVQYKEEKWQVHLLNRNALKHVIEGGLPIRSINGVIVRYRARDDVVIP